MPVRKTESRLPASMTPSDLGESVTSSDGKYALVSFLTSPLPPGRPNTYVLFVTDNALAGSIKSFKWDITEDGTLGFSQTTDVGEIAYQTNNIGNIDVSVRLLDNTDAVVGRISLIQEIGPLYPALESEIADAVEKDGPGAANLDAVRGIFNDFRIYYLDVKPTIPESDDSFQRFIGGIIFRGGLKSDPDERASDFTQLADALDNNPDAFPIEAAPGIGTCAIRLALLAMNHPSGSPLLPWTELPEPSDQNAMADEQLRQKLKDFSDDDKVDLLNLSRFPKTNISLCAKIIENLRDKYFAGASFKDVMTGMDGTRGHWIMKHYLKGPIKTS
jgi:hypothetical protein